MKVILPHRYVLQYSVFCKRLIPLISALRAIRYRLLTSPLLLTQHREPRPLIVVSSEPNVSVPSWPRYPADYLAVDFEIEELNKDHPVSVNLSCSDPAHVGLTHII